MPTSNIVDDLEFPRIQARTGRFRFGLPQSFVGSADGERIAFLRSRTGTDSRGCIWVASSTAAGEITERVIVDVAHPGGSVADELPAAERARRERLRESGSGVTAFSANADLTVFCFAFNGSLFVAETAPGTDGEFAIRMLDVPGPVVDPRLSPDGFQVAWVASDSVYVAPVSGAEPARLVAQAAGSNCTVGLANFLAAEEFDRFRGFWWSPDSDALLVEEVDSSEVQQWWISDPASPETSPRSVRYPAAGTANPQVTLAIYPLGSEAGAAASTTASTEAEASEKRVSTRWDSGFEYVTSVSWPKGSGPLLTVMNREQNRCQVLRVAPASGSTTVLDRIADPKWVETAAGTPLLLDGTTLISTGSDAMADTITVGGNPVDLGGYLLRSVYGVTKIDGHRHLALGVHQDSSENQIGLVALDDTDGMPASEPSELTLITDGEAWHSAWLVGGGRLVISRSTSASFATSFTWGELSPTGFAELGAIQSAAQIPDLQLNLERHLVGEHALNTTVQWPVDHVPGSRKLPVIMNPYGGPHSQRVVQSGRAFAETQWLADQGFCVIVSDVRGASGRPHDEQRTFYRDLAAAPLGDQVSVIEWASATWPNDVDPARVGIMGWSFGGYLAALAVLQRPDRFAAAIAGAPVTDWRLYDTAYTERYLGDPRSDSQPYETSDLIPLAAELTKPLMIIHGMADDNVFAAHSLKLSGALTAAGRAHTFVPLANVTHMTPQVEVAANLLMLQRDFFKANL